MNGVGDLFRFARSFDAFIGASVVFWTTVLWLFAYIYPKLTAGDFEARVFGWMLLCAFFISWFGFLESWRRLRIPR